MKTHAMTPDPEERDERCDISTMCLQCGAEMRPEHAHMRCPSCGWRDACCEGVY